MRGLRSPLRVQLEWVVLSSLHTWRDPKYGRLPYHTAETYKISKWQHKRTSTNALLKCTYRLQVLYLLQYSSTWLFQFISYTFLIFIWISEHQKLQDLTRRLGSELPQPAISRMSIPIYLRWKQEICEPATTKSTRDTHIWSNPT